MGERRKRMTTPGAIIPQLHLKTNQISAWDIIKMPGHVPTPTWCGMNSPLRTFQLGSVSADIKAGKDLRNGNLLVPPMKIATDILAGPSCVEIPATILKIF